MKDINDILAKYFSGEASPEESSLVAEWKRENEAEYTVLSEAWAEADTTLLEGLEFKKFDHKTAWDKVDAKFVDDKEIKIIKLRFYKNVAAACAILLVGLAGFWFLNRNNMELVSNTANTPKEISLPDGSTVWLAANSTLEYSSDFTNDRSLNLEGEGFFEVARDEAHPFIINTEFGDIEVLGTAFNVDVNKSSTLVSVDHGKVAVRNEGGEIKLTAGESANATENGVSEKTEADINYDAWKTGEFNFQNTPLVDVIELLNKHYDQQIELVNMDKAQEPLNGEFNNPPVKEIIDVIVLTCDVTPDFGDDIIRLK